MGVPEYGSDLVVDLLRAAGIEYVAMNPGATFRGIHDSIVNYGGNRRPELIQCCHEEIAVGIAHGYAKAAGKPMGAILHNLVGLQHATMAIFNAWCDRAPVLVMGGTGPMAADRRRPWIDWVHTALVQGEQVRQYVKWDDQPASVQAIPNSLLRAHRLTVAEPQGPVYVCFDAALQEERLAAPIPIPPVERYLTPGRLGPDPGALETAAAWLAGARRPVIIAGMVGRDPAAIPILVDLAAALAAPVVDTGDRFSFPSTNDLDLTLGRLEALHKADVVLALDVPDLFGALSGPIPKSTERTVQLAVPADARIIHVTAGELRGKSWSADYQEITAVDLTLPADTGVVLPALLDRVQVLVGRQATGRAEREEQRGHWSRRHAELDARSRAEVERRWNESPICVPRLAAEVGQALQGLEWVLAGKELKGNWCRRLWGFERPGCFLGGGQGAGLGYCMGASLGASLAHRGTDKVIVNMQPEGDFLMTPQALWTAVHHRLPILTIMVNNASYYNDEEHQERIAIARGRPPENKGIGIHLSDPLVDFAALARSFSMWAEGPVTDPSHLQEVLARALAVVQDGQPALVDVRVGAR